jgi:hypothetical protein
MALSEKEFNEFILPNLKKVQEDQVKKYHLTHYLITY